MSLGLGSGVAQAATITFAYEGIIDQALGGAAFDAFLGETLRVEYTFDDTAMGNVDAAPSPNVGSYTVSAFTATVGVNSYHVADSSSIFVLDDTDRYGFNLDAEGLNSGPTIGELAMIGVRLEFKGSTLGAIMGDGLPVIQPDPSAFNELQLRIDFETGDGEGELSASIVTISVVSAVPVPAAVWLFGSGLLGLVGVARRKTSTV